MLLGFSRQAGVFASASCREPRSLKHAGFNSLAVQGLGFIDCMEFHLFQKHCSQDFDNREHELLQALAEFPEAPALTTCAKKSRFWLRQRLQRSGSCGAEFPREL